MTDTQPKPRTPFLDLILAHCGNPPLPDGYDTWGWKTVRPDLRSYGGYRWPWPGGTVTDPKARPGSNPCPTSSTGGFCVALSWRGARSGGHGGTTALLLAYRQADVLARSDIDGKVRVREARVHEVIDVHRLMQKASKGVNLADADLADAYLMGADLMGADLAGAYLMGADLMGADLAGANLMGADLTRADLARADLADANLMGANLTRANLARANLADANLAGAYLMGANLTRANLADANLAGAYLTRADLADADLARANLADANLRDANLTRANLARANLARANLARARNLDQATGYKHAAVADA
jgi:uncharacterized protein YjbI with pentapeptide repeats